MKFTISWLKDHLETTATNDTIIETLTMVGLEVEEVTDTGAALRNFVTAHVVSAESTPMRTSCACARWTPAPGN